MKVSLGLIQPRDLLALIFVILGEKTKVNSQIVFTG